MRIIGIDPGIAIVGYGIIEIKSNSIVPLDYGIISTEAKLNTPKRLEIIYNLLNQIIDVYKPTDLAIEELFFSRNTSSAIKVAQARGVQILSAKLKGLGIYEYTPLQIKEAVTGYGRAEKEQVQHMVKYLLNLKEIPKPDDASDALAVAITHSSAINFKEEFKMR